MLLAPYLFCYRKFDLVASLAWSASMHKLEAPRVAIIAEPSSQIPLELSIATADEIPRMISWFSRVCRPLKRINPGAVTRPA
jgi:hypothetical protein